LLLGQDKKIAVEEFALVEVVQIVNINVFHPAEKLNATGLGCQKGIEGSWSGAKAHAR
jgi:hypothetical protein